MPFKDPERAREYGREQSRRRNGPERKEYERERKNRKRVEQYMLLPEPERTRKLESNARRRAYKLRWKVDKY
jgi:hypothetical protein